jgi:hypothetical protein
MGLNFISIPHANDVVTRVVGCPCTGNSYGIEIFAPVA